MQFNYIMFPLPLVQTVLTERNGISDVFKYGIYRMAMYQKTDEYNAYRQIIYCYFNIESEKVDDLTDFLKNTLDEIEDIVDEDYRGFNGNGKNFEPDYLIDILSDYGRRTYISCILSYEELEESASKDFVDNSVTLQLKRYHAGKRASRERIMEMLQFAINSH